MISYTSARAAAPMDTLPVGAGALVGPDSSQVAGLVGVDAEPAAPGASIDAMLADHDARLAALEDGAA